jgi:endonuclease-3
MKRPRVAISQSNVEDLDDNEEAGFEPTRMLAEYELIARYRCTRRATVDGFNAFLLSLHGAEGRYWALVACLLSVQCLDDVALKAVRKLMSATAASSSAGITNTNDSSPAGLVSTSCSSSSGVVSHCSGSAAAVLALSPALLESLLMTLNFRKAKERCAPPPSLRTPLLTFSSRASYKFFFFNPRFVTECSRAVIDKWGGEVPEAYKDLLTLPGVGPKIANLMRSVAFGKEDAGIVVDTHVYRVARLLRWVPPLAVSAAASAAKAVGVSSSASSAVGLFARCPQRTRGTPSCAADGPEGTREALEAWVPYSKRAQFALDVVGFGQITRQRGWAAAFLRHVREEAANLSDASPAAQVFIAEAIVRKMEGSVAGADDETQLVVVGEAPGSVGSNEKFSVKLTCGACTFLNDHHRATCEMCGAILIDVSGLGTLTAPWIEVASSRVILDTLDEVQLEPDVPNVNSRNTASIPKEFSDATSFEGLRTSAPARGSTDTLYSVLQQQESNCDLTEQEPPAASQPLVGDTDATAAAPRHGKFGKLSLKKKA